MSELFQFDSTELDFGVYRILNLKRIEIQRFLDEHLPSYIHDAMEHGASAKQAHHEAALNASREKLVSSIGSHALDSKGEIDPIYQESPVAQEYLLIKSQGTQFLGKDAMESAVYNHLYSFFRRYYKDGDFISQRRYSQTIRYVIPYSGEETFFHWVNNDQYYVKSEEYFRNYKWYSPNGVSVHFRLIDADIEQSSVQGESSFFLPAVSESQWDRNTKEIHIPVVYRPLSQDEVNGFGNRQPQKRINKAVEIDLEQKFRDEPDAYVALMAPRNVEKAETVPFVKYHLDRYTSRNNADFFIHRDLEGFLEQELDFYVQNEVLDVRNIDTNNELPALVSIEQSRLVNQIGKRIILFLSQIEEFQKLLWEKRKFVIETQHCIALRLVGESFYEEILKSDAQWEEWKSNVPLDSITRSRSFLASQPTLMLDTKHFGVEFTDRLLATINDLESNTDGLMIHGDNWQALRLIEEEFREAIQCTYIDPPYNTNASAILYKNDYKDSSWLSLMQSRLVQNRNLLAKNGIICCAIDDEEATFLRVLLNRLYPKELGVVPVRTNPAGRKSKGKISPSHEYAIFVGNGNAAPGPLPKTEKQRARYPLIDENGNFAWSNLIRSGSNDRRQDRPKLFYPIYVHKDDSIRIPELNWNEAEEAYDVIDEPTSDETVVLPTKIQGGTIIEKNWHRGWQQVKKDPSVYRVRREQNSTTSETDISIDFKTYMDNDAMPNTWWDDKRYASANYGAQSLKDLFGKKPFDFPKAIALVEDCLRASRCTPQATILDYFAGSGTTGHATINLNREDDGNRKFILIESGDYFHTVLLPRLKKVAFTPTWRDGKPNQTLTDKQSISSPRIFKYIRLESYDETLDSIQIDDSGDKWSSFESYDEYLVKYLLKWDTRDSETLLNLASLADPFQYYLRVQVNGVQQVRLVDVPETFNYLIGLKVQTRRVLFNESNARYLVFCGEERAKPGKRVSVIWRSTKNWNGTDFERDRNFIVRENIVADSDRVLVNGDSCIPDAEPIEPIFKARMFGSVN